MKTIALKSFLAIICLTLFSSAAFSQNGTSGKKHSLAWQSKADSSVKDSASVLHLTSITSPVMENKVAVYNETIINVEGGSPPYKFESTVLSGNPGIGKNSPTSYSVSRTGSVSLTVSDAKGQTVTKVYTSH